MSDSELTTRTLVALAMGPVFFAAIFIGGGVFFLFVALLAGRALWELPALFRVTDESTPLRALSLPVALLLLGDAWLAGGAHWGVILLGGTGLVLLVEIMSLAYLIIEEKQTGAIYALLVTPTTTWQIFAAKTVVGSALASSETLIVIALMGSFGGSPAGIVINVLLGALLATGFAFLVATGVAKTGNATA